MCGLIDIFLCEMWAYIMITDDKVLVITGKEQASLQLIAILAVHLSHVFRCSFPQGFDKQVDVSYVPNITT